MTKGKCNVCVDYGPTASKSNPDDWQDMWKSTTNNVMDCLYSCLPKSRKGCQWDEKTKVCLAFPLFTIGGGNGAEGYSCWAPIGNKCKTPTWYFGRGK